MTGFDLHLGWHPQGDGKWYYGLSVENGRVKDEGALRLRTGLRAIVERFQPELRLTPMQDMLLCDLDRRRPAGRSNACWTSTASPRPEQLSQRAAATAWPARRSRPAAWPSPSRSGRCPASSTSWKPS